MNFSFFSEALTFFVTFLCQDKKVNGGKCFTSKGLILFYLILCVLFVVIFIKIIFLFFTKVKITHIHHTSDKVLESDFTFNCFFTNQ